MLSLDRRDFLRLSAGAVVTGAAFSASVTTSIAPAHAAGPQRARQFRALWISSVANIDWPSRTGLSAAVQRREFEDWMDLARSLRLNAVISQVRPSADAFWPSPHEPWSQYLTGTQGKDPGYDPLAAQIRAAHERNLEFHAWFNPYRVSTQSDPKKLVASHPARTHPDWVFAYGGKLYYNPGIPEVRRFVQDAMMDAVTRYDLDAVHFDDYFYPYPVEGQTVPDQATYARYGGGASLADWRRSCIDTLVEEMHERIRSAKPWVKFGISPFGIWRNRSADPAGSATSGLQSYEAISADSRRWVRQGWVDYICPQVYWQIGLAAADYAELARWWASTVEGTDVALYIGQAAYKLTSGDFTDRRELVRHQEVNARYARIAGDAYFSASDLRADPRGAISALVDEAYPSPAIVPAIAHLGGRAPQAPLAVTAARTRDGVRVRWQRPPGSATSYAIWRLDGTDTAPVRAEDPSRLVATLRARPGRAQEYVHRGGSGSGYAVTAYDRTWNASEPAAARTR